MLESGDVLKQFGDVNQAYSRDQTLRNGINGVQCKPYYETLQRYWAELSYHQAFHWLSTLFYTVALQCWPVKCNFIGL